MIMHSSLALSKTKEKITVMLTAKTCATGINLIATVLLSTSRVIQCNQEINR